MSAEIPSVDPHLYMEWFPRLVSFALRYDRDNAEDLAQITIIKASRNFFTNETGFLLSLLLTMVKQQAIDHNRSPRDRLNKTLISLDDIEIRSDAENPEVIVERQQDIDETLILFDTLSPNQSRALKLHVLGYSMDEIALSMNKTNQAVRLLIYHARENVQKQKMRKNGSLG